MRSTPKLSIVTITYNQAKYIEQTLRSFVMQKTNFDFEVIVADDCSTDDTPTIIREFAKNYPDIFNLVLRQKNIGIQSNLNNALRKAKGEYIAICEGDDYWTDVTKLQKQVDFLENNSDYALCFHLVDVVFENDNRHYIYPKQHNKNEFTVDNLLKRNFIQTNSVVYRKQKYDTLPDDILPLDWYLHLYHAQYGKIGFIDEVMSVYRKHPGGVWWNAHNDLDEIWKKYGVEHLSLYVEFFKLYGNIPRYADKIHILISEMLKNVIRVDEKYNKQLLKMILKKYSREVRLFLISQHSKIESSELEIKNKDNKLKKAYEYINSLERKLDNSNHRIKRQALEISEMKSSRFWKIRNITARAVGKKVI